MSNVNLNTDYIPTTINQINSDFAGREDFDETKILHIHRRNRAYVWDLQMQQKFLDSILKGYCMQPIVCCSKWENGSERRYIMDGGNRVTTIRRILDGKVRPLTDNERRKIESTSIILTVMRNLESKDQRIMFQRLNKNIKVSDGQLYAMSQEDSSLVKEAMALLNDDNYPLRELITRHFFDTRDTDNDGKSNLANAVALVSGAHNGVHYITKSFNTQDEEVDNKGDMDRDKIVRILGSLFEIFTLADNFQPLTDRRRLRGQWSVGYLLGPMLYDILENPGETRRIQEKWARFIEKLRKDENAVEAIKLSGAQNLTATRYKRINRKVDVFMNENRIATEAELKLLTHPEEKGIVEEENEEDIESVTE